MLSARFLVTIHPRRRKNRAGALIQTMSGRPLTTSPIADTRKGSCSSPITVIQRPAGARRDSSLRTASILSIFSGPRIMRSPVG